MTNPYLSVVPRLDDETAGPGGHVPTTPEAPTMADVTGMGPVPASQRSLAPTVSDIPADVTGMGPVPASQQVRVEPPVEAEQEPNPYLGDVRERTDASQALAQIHLREALETDPKRAAEILKLSRETGFSPEGLADPENFRQVSNDQLVEMNRRILANAPATMRIMAQDPWLARLMRDSLPQVVEIEETFKKSAVFLDAARKREREYSTFEYAAGLSRALPAGAAEAPAMMVQGLGESYDILARGLAAPIIALGGEKAKTFLDRPAPFGFDPSGMFLKEPGAALRGLARDLRGDYEGYWFDVAHGLGQFGSQAALYGVWAPLGMTSLTMQGVTIMSEQIAEDDAPQWRKDLAMMAGGGVMALTQTPVFDFMFGKIAVPVKNQVMQGVVRALGTGIGEATQETLENVFMDATQILLTNPDARIGLGQALEEGAVGFGVGTIAGAIVEAGIARRGRVARQAAERDAEEYTRMFEAAAAAPMLEQDPESFAQALGEITEGATVFVDPDRLTRVLADAGIDISVLPSAQTQIQEGTDFGPGVEIPVSELVTALAGTEAETALIPHLRADPETQTLAEAREFSERARSFFQEEAQRILAEGQRGQEFADASSVVESDVLTQLEALQRFSARTNESYAKLIGAFYTTVADRVGVTPLQLRDGWVDQSGQRRRGYQLRLGDQPLAGSPALQQFPAATTRTFTREGVGELLDTSNWTILTAKNPAAKELSPEENQKRDAELEAELEAELKAMGLGYTPVIGQYGRQENSFAVTGLDYVAAARLGEKYGQESVLTRYGLVYPDGTVDRATGLTIHDIPPEDFFSTLPDGTTFSVDLEFNREPIADVVRERDGTELEGLASFAQSVSTRLPSPQAGRGDPHLTTGLDVDFELAKNDPKFAKALADTIRPYPQLRITARKPEAVLEQAVTQMQGNLRWLFDQVPPETRERSKRWYEGGRQIVERWVEKYEGRYSDAQLAGVLAAMSPQLAWDTNVTLAERIVDTWDTQQNAPWTPEMEAKAVEIFAQPGTGGAAALEAIRGKTLGELTDSYERAVWVRVFDQTYNPRPFRQVTPEGGWADWMRTVKGAKTNAGWQNGHGTIAHAIAILEDANPENISRQLGGEHKVRNFYNLFDPSDATSVTIDTHAVAAALLSPLSGSSTEVLQNFGAPSSAPLGMSGTYVVYAEAYRRLAAETGMLPREIQSITWEAVRRMYTAPFKSAFAKQEGPKGKKRLTETAKKMQAEFHGIWKAYTTGKETLDATREKLVQFAGGIQPPGWTGSDTGLDAGAPDSSYAEGVLGTSRPDRPAGPRAGVEATPRDPEGAVAAGSGAFDQSGVPGRLTRPPVNEDGTITLWHWGKVPSLSALDPNMSGTGINVADLRRRDADPDNWLNRTYYGIAIGQDGGYRKESGLGPNLYSTTVDADRIYDMSADPDGLRPRAGEITGWDNPTSVFEKRIKDAGYVGYWVAHPQLGLTSAVFEKLPAKPTEAPVGVFAQSGKGPLGFYSQLARAVSEVPAKMETQPAAQWKAWLTANAGKLGVKKDEIQWSGVTDWLDLQGKRKVTKAEIGAFLEQGGVQVQEASAQQPKFARYTVPGGTNYREVLLTLPQRDPGGIKARLAAIANEMQDADGDRYSDLFKERAALAARYRSEIDQNRFRSSHWDEANVLAHLRMDDRTGPNGEKILFVHEIQSDWGQEGKRKGFASAPDEARVSQITARLRELAKADQDNSPEWDVLTNEKAALTKPGVPAAPFVTDTKAWVALALKRAIAMAADGGYDRVALINGQQAADLYDLSKQISEVAYNKSSQFLRALDMDGDPVINERKTPEELPDVIGKDLADKILQTEGNFVQLEGDGLRVGGEGMRAFYDQIVPQVANDVLKRLGGGKVGPVSLVEASSEPEMIGVDDNGDAIYDDGIQVGAESQIGFDITPAMREKVQAEGLPLFQGNRGQFDPGTLEITLLADTDLSTFLHETGHFFLTVYSDLATQPGAPAEIRADLQTFLDQYAGGISPEQWAALPIDQQRAGHEAFAESFEQYLFKGEAPTPELKGLFRRFSAFLVRVYGSLRQFLAGAGRAPEINPELAAVFDRMLASDAQIETAREARGHRPLFENAADAGMTAEQFARYTELDTTAREEAQERLRVRSLRDMKWLQNRLNKTIAALQKRAAAARAEVREQIEAEVSQRPVYQAIEFLRNGRAVGVDGGDIQVTEGNKLSIPALELTFPEGALIAPPDWRSLGTGKRGMLAKNGLDPQIVAEMFGYRSGEALVQDLVEARPIKDEIEGLTDQRMLEEHSELATPEGIQRSADEAIHNEARSRMVATELSALASEIGSPRDLLRAAKAAAAEIIAGKTSRTLKAWQFAAAETRAGKAALDALRRGDRAEAARQKRAELLNHVAAKQAHEAAREMEKTIARFRRIAAAKDKETSKTRDMDMVNAVRLILSGYGFVTDVKTERAKNYIEAVRRNNPEAGEFLVDSIEEGLRNTKDWRQLTVEELAGLKDNVEGLWAFARESRILELEGKQIEIAQAQDELSAKLREQGLPDRSPGEGQAVTAAEGRWMTFSSLMAKVKRVAQWAEGMDGGPDGPFRRYVWYPIKDAADLYRVQRAEYFTQFRNLLQTVAPSIRPGTIDAREIGYVFGKGKAGLGKAELLHAILHTGNESNKKKLLLGRGWAELDAAGEMDTRKWDAFVARAIGEGKLTKADFDFAQGVWDMLESMKPAAQKAHRAVFGRYFDEVTADGFDTPWGRYRGGYVPASVDTQIVHDGQLRQLAETENENMSYSFPSSPKGFTMSRVEYNRPLALDLRLLGQHIDKVLIFSNMQPAVNDVRRVLSGGGVDTLLNRYDPGIIAHMLIPWLNRSARQAVDTQSNDAQLIDGALRRVRNWTGAGLMFGNVINTLQQFTGIPLSMVKVPPSRLGSAMAHFVSRPNETLAFIRERSPFMVDRLNNKNALMYDQVNEILLNPSVYQKAENWSMRHAYIFQIMADRAMAPIVWLGAYNEAMATAPAGMAHTDTELRARRAADSAVQETQMDQSPEAIASFESGSPFRRMFTQFAGWFNMTANTMATQIKIAKKNPDVLAGYTRMAYVTMFAYLIPAALSEIIAVGMRGGPDDEDGDGWLDDWLAAIGWGTFRYGTAMIPFAGQALNAASSSMTGNVYDSRMLSTPVIGAGEAAARTAAWLIQLGVDPEEALDKRPGRVIRDIGMSVNAFTGLPTNLLSKPIGYAADVATGEVYPTSGADFARGIITGTASPESK